MQGYTQHFKLFDQNYLPLNYLIFVKSVQLSTPNAASTSPIFNINLPLFKYSIIEFPIFISAIIT